MCWLLPRAVCIASRQRSIAPVVVSPPVAAAVVVQPPRVTVCRNMNAPFPSCLCSAPVFVVVVHVQFDMSGGSGLRRFIGEHTRRLSDVDDGEREFRRQSAFGGGARRARGFASNAPRRDFPRGGANR